MVDMAVCVDMPMCMNMCVVVDGVVVDGVVVDGVVVDGVVDGVVTRKLWFRLYSTTEQAQENDDEDEECLHVDVNSLVQCDC